MRDEPHSTSRTATTRLRSCAAAILCAVLVPFLALPAAAQTQADQWAAAIREQQEAIAANRGQRAKCLPGDARCAALEARGRQMEENLGRLQRQHARMTGAPVPASTAPVSRYAPPAPAPQPQPAGRGFFSMLFGGGSTSPQPAPSPQSGSWGAPGVTINGEPVGELRQNGDELIGPATPWSGNYRTLCVRTCDGFFFPVSFNSSPGRLRIEANVCKAMCPQAETRLYYHDATGQEAENAVAADDGSPITKLPNAFLYRTKRVDGCTCGTPDPRTLPRLAGGLAGTAEARTVFDRVALPRPRPSPDQDPETQAMELSGLTADPVEALAPARAEVAEVAASAPIEPPKVRTVGPKFFSDR